ncbi:MAG: 30S ribosomal protein S20 [Clostridiales bacterium]|nr:30S ribosomal protein S20 [Clostridiales bacterium]
MANIKSAKKRVLIAEIRRQRNMAAKSQMKSQLKKFHAAVSEGNKEAAATQLQASVSILDKTAGKGVIHKNAASRRKSNLYRAFNGM